MLMFTSTESLARDRTGPNRSVNVMKVLSSCGRGQLKFLCIFFRFLIFVYYCLSLFYDFCYFHSIFPNYAGALESTLAINVDRQYLKTISLNLIPYSARCDGVRSSESHIPSLPSPPYGISCQAQGSRDLGRLRERTCIYIRRRYTSHTHIQQTAVSWILVTSLLENGR